MRNGMIGVIVGMVIALAIAFLIWGRPLSVTQGLLSQATSRTQEVEASARSALAAYAARKPREAHITLQQVGTTSDCTATIDNKEMGANREEDVEWYILQDEQKPCTENGAWAVWLEFTESDFPLDDRKFRIGKKHKKLKVKRLANERNFTYKVLMAEHSGNQYMLIDPDLEVEPPNPLVPPPPAPPAPASPAAPPSKQ